MARPGPVKAAAGFARGRKRRQFDFDREGEGDGSVGMVAAMPSFEGEQRFVISRTTGQLVVGKSSGTVEAELAADMAAKRRKAATEKIRVDCPVKEAFNRVHIPDLSITVREKMHVLLTSALAENAKFCAGEAARQLSAADIEVILHQTFSSSSCLLTQQEYSLQCFPTRDAPQLMRIGCAPLTLSSCSPWPTGKRRRLCCLKWRPRRVQLNQASNPRSSI
jgi:hypothetical protein